MKLKFKNQEFQERAVKAVVDCFEGQPKAEGIRYAGGPAAVLPDNPLALEHAEFRNQELCLDKPALLENIRKVQLRGGLDNSKPLVESEACKGPNLDIEMETGTGKTYCYARTILELNKLYGWSKFIVVVPSIAIREGVHKSMEITADHFQELYGKKINYFIYRSDSLHLIDIFANDDNIQLMIINMQAFNSRGKDNRRIYESLDEFQSRKPIDVVKSTNPILILDEPQKIEGRKTAKSLQEFNPLFVLRYSATHKTSHNLVYRLDALDAYNQKLVKKIEVRGISIKGLKGIEGYLYLDSIAISKQAPVARMEYERKQGDSIRRKIRNMRLGDNLFELSGELEQYRGLVISDIDAIQGQVEFNNRDSLGIGEAANDITVEAIRGIQIREAISAHIHKERELFDKGIKCLSLFFIDDVAKYRAYDENGLAVNGEYAKVFEEQYREFMKNPPENLLISPEYRKYLEAHPVRSLHNGYFSIDKRTSRLRNPETRKATGETNDADAYDLILKDKERLLSFQEPIRFIFSHSALREGWDNPNVFVICTLKHSDSTTTRRQEVGRGLRLSVNQEGVRQDSSDTVHDINRLSVVASESYGDFVKGLQKDIRESIASRPRKANKEYFANKTVEYAGVSTTITQKEAVQINHWLIKNDYIDENEHITDAYHDAKKNGELEPMPGELREKGAHIDLLISDLFSEGQLPAIANERDLRTLQPNTNIKKKEFQALWRRINKKAAYLVNLDSEGLIKKCIHALDERLEVPALRYQIEQGEQIAVLEYEDLQNQSGFREEANRSVKGAVRVDSPVKHDLIGEIVERVGVLTRTTIGTILAKIKPRTFEQYRNNPEGFFARASNLIRGELATVIVERLAYNCLDDKHELDIFANAKFSRNGLGCKTRLRRHIYNRINPDSKTEERFVRKLDKSEDVVVYAKLPRGFAIPTPVGDYSPDWAIAFKKDSVKHVYFIAETKGTIDTMELRDTEKAKTRCAKKFFKELSGVVKGESVEYGVVADYDDLMNTVSAP